MFNVRDGITIVVVYQLENGFNVINKTSVREVLHLFLLKSPRERDARVEQQFLISLKSD